VWAERNYERVVHLTNTSESPLELLAIKGDCSCVSFGKLPPGLLPGASVAIPLTIDLTRAFESGKAVAEQKTNLTITVRAGTVLKDQYATLTAASDFRFSPSRLFSKSGCGPSVTPRVLAT